MTTFDKREEGFEKQFAHDEELRFKATARRNKLLGLWAAQKMGLSGAEAETYAKEVVTADLEEPGEDDVFHKIRRDFDAHGVTASDHHDRTDGASDRANQSRPLRISAPAIFAFLDFGDELSQYPFPMAGAVHYSKE